MLLVHGTSIKVAQSSIELGLQPRGKRKSKWEVASHHNSIYLTNAYALHYALNAKKPTESSVGLIEINTDELSILNLFADEDALGQADKYLNLTPTHMREASLTEKTLWFSKNLLMAKLQGYDYNWSLRVLGNCSHLGPIPAQAITRVVELNVNSVWWLRFFDPTITLLNYNILGNIYRGSQLLLIGRIEQALDEAEPEIKDDLNQIEKYIKPNRKIFYTND